MTVTDELLQNARRFAEGFDEDALAPVRLTHVAVVACMDARLDPQAILGLASGDAHVIRNAGGVVSDDVVRSLTISQRLLGTTEIILVHHTDCGMVTFRDDDVKDQIATDTGIRPPFALEAFPRPRRRCAPVDRPHPRQPLRPPQARPGLHLRRREGHAAGSVLIRHAARRSGGVVLHRDVLKRFSASERQTRRCAGPGRSAGRWG
jgi:carbonic anhydrase